MVEADFVVAPLQPETILLFAERQHGFDSGDNRPDFRTSCPALSQILPVVNTLFFEGELSRVDHWQGTVVQLLPQPPIL